MYVRSTTILSGQIHWNSPKKLDVQIKERGFFIGIDRSFQQMEGNFLRRSLAELACKDNTANPTATIAAANIQQLTNDKDCVDFDEAATRTFRTHLYYLEYDHQAVEASQARVSIVTQLSPDRLGLLETLCRSWSGPVSVALYASDHQVLEVCPHHCRKPVHSRHS